MAPRVPATRDSSTRRAFDWLFRNPDTGRVAIVQFPNLPLAIFIVASLVRRVFDPGGGAGTIVAVAATVGLLWWAVEEVFAGDSRFRRALGAAVLLSTVAGLFVR